MFNVSKRKTREAVPIAGLNPSTFRGSQYVDR
jgi:hypothetical protein